MSAPQKFRSAFNGFNREDVVSYLEYLNNKHAAQVNQLTAEAETLRSRLETTRPCEDQSDAVAALEQECNDLRARLEELQARYDALEQHAPAAPVITPDTELEIYRRAERTERMARERAELVYHQINGVLAEVTAKVDGTAAEIGAMTDQVMAQLSQLQVAVSSSKQALKDAAATMYAIRPDNN